MPRLTPSEARDTLRRARVPLPVDFHALDSATVERVTIEADAARYRVPRNANGSRARYYHAHLVRTANRKES